MNLFVNNKSETPLYEQLYNQIVAQILSEKVEADDCLPSIRFVAKELGISVIPVKTAYEMLERDNYIYTIPGKGCFVADVDCLSSKRMTLAEQQLTEVIHYCKLLGLSQWQVQEIIQKLYH